MRSHLYRNTYRVPSARLSSWDYGTPGGYFVTICTKDRVHCLGNIAEGIMQLSAIGIIVERFWQEIPEHYENVRIDEYVVMPNHIHGILFIERRLDNDDGKNNNGYFSTPNNDNHLDLDNPIAVPVGTAMEPTTTWEIVVPKWISIDIPNNVRNIPQTRILRCHHPFLQIFRNAMVSPKWVFSFCMATAILRTDYLGR